MSGARISSAAPVATSIATAPASAMRAAKAASAPSSRRRTYFAWSMGATGAGSRAKAVAGPCCASATGSIVGAATPSFADTRLARPRNSISASHGNRVSASGSRTSSASSPSSSGTSRRSVTRSRESRMRSACPTSTSRRFGCLISPARASRVSRSPYSAMSCAAVLIPIPGAPGTLSIESPASACTSITRSGPTPNFSITSSRPIGLFFSVSNMTMPGATSCIRSLSAEMIVTRPPAAAACVA